MMQWSYVPSRALPAKVQRRVTLWRRANRAFVAPDRPAVCRIAVGRVRRFPTCFETF